jgi:hypothetical protein
MNITFVETRVFTQRMQELGLEDTLRSLQEELRANPRTGDLDPGTGGLRKARMADVFRGKGKRGGARVHYLYVEEGPVIYLLFAYGKGELRTLTAQQKKMLKAVVGQIREEWRSRPG